jgi:hypothetical protein
MKNYEQNAQLALQPREKMKFRILESRHSKLSGIMEGDSFNQVFETIADRYRIPSSNLIAYCELQKNGNLRYIIIKGIKKIAVLEPVPD